MTCGSVDSNQADANVDPERSGKLFVLYRMMLTMRAMKTGERIVIVSNYTSTLDLIGKLCDQNNWPVLRLDGTTAGKKRTELVDKFNDPYSGAFAFLLSSKAGGCGINLIGGSRLVLFDPDWNPASDKQAAGRIWREGQKRRCFIYRFMSTGSIEEKIIQRQLSKEGLQNIVEDTDQVNEISSADLKALFVLMEDTPSDTHDTLKCKRCSNVREKGDLLSNASSIVTFSPQEAIACVGFVQEFVGWLRAQAEIVKKAFSTEDFESILSNLALCIEAGTLSDGDQGEMGESSGHRRHIYRTSAEFSRALNSVVKAVHKEQENASLNIGISSKPSNVDTGTKGHVVLDAEGNIVEGPIDGGMDGDIEGVERCLPVGVHMEEEFLRRWYDFIPSLSEIASKHKNAATSRAKKKTILSPTHAATVAIINAASSNTSPSHANKTGNAGSGSGSDGDTKEEEEGVEEEQEEEKEEDEEDRGGYAEQVGCPDDTDFNKWSHHVSPSSTDDEVLQKALSADIAESVSFVFGLEVNWNLLKYKEEEEREAKMAVKEKKLQDLKDLNLKRDEKRAKKEEKEREEELRHEERGIASDQELRAQIEQAVVDGTLKRERKGVRIEKRREESGAGDESSGCNGGMRMIPMEGMYVPEAGFEVAIRSEFSEGREKGKNSKKEKKGKCQKKERGDRGNVMEQNDVGEGEKKKKKKKKQRMVIYDEDEDEDFQDTNIAYNDTINIVGAVDTTSALGIAEEQTKENKPERKKKKDRVEEALLSNSAK